MTWQLGPTTGVVEAIDSHGKPFHVGPPPWMSQADLADELGEDAEPHRLERPLGAYEAVIAGAILVICAVAMISVGVWIWLRIFV